MNFDISGSHSEGSQTIYGLTAISLALCRNMISVYIRSDIYQ